MWGAEEGGVWELNAEGKKVFKDEELHKAIMTGQKTADGRGAAYYGLYDPTTQFYQSGYTRGVLTAGQLNPYLYTNSYPPEYQVRDEMVRVAGENCVEEFPKYAMVLSGENTMKFNDFFWGQSWPLHNTMVLAKDDAEFEANYQKVYDAFMQAGDYEKAKQELLDYELSH